MRIRSHTLLAMAIAGFAAAAMIASASADQRGDAGSSGITKTTSAAASQTERNKETVVRFYNKALNEKQPDEALEYVGDHYKQHNPTAEDGREGFRKFINWIRSDHPDSHSEIEQIFADGDYVILNVHMVIHPGERGLAIGEIFRLEGGKIVEHWDRIQPVPETSKNNNTMF
jgi:predicted SnoaL-like aldol condensation-catalyzing enzyme